MKVKRFTIFSDIHETHQTVSIQPSDFLLICGDIILRKNPSYLKSFGKWLEHLPVKNIVMILGNHERDCQIDSSVISTVFPVIPHLSIVNGFTTIDNFHFYGMSFPFVAKSIDYNHFRKTKKYPLIMMSHEPPFGILDYGIWKRKIILDNFYHAGSEVVKDVVEKLTPELHCFGHCHSSHGIMKLNKTLFVNGAIVDDDNMLSFKPIQISYENNQFLPLQQHKCITLNQFLKQISEKPFNYLCRSKEYHSLLNEKRNKIVNALK